MNVFSNRAAGNTVSASWSDNITIGKNIFDFYNSCGDVTISTSTQIPSMLDGPIVVKRYNNLNVSALLTTQYRCRGFMLLVDKNLTVTSTGEISMTGRGARGNASMGLYDIMIPDFIKLVSNRISKRDVLAKIRSQGWCLCDRWLWDEWGKIDGVNATVWTGGTVLLSASGCGTGGMRTYGGTTQGSQMPGVNGTAGVNGGNGGGGSGGCSWSATNSGIGGKGRPWGGGSGGGGFHPAYTTNEFRACVFDADQWGGKGGDGHCTGDGSNWNSYPGAGNEAGIQAGAAVTGTSFVQEGTGGNLFIIVKGNVAINSGGWIDCDGKNGGGNNQYQYQHGGGGSGGGHVSIICGETYTNNGTVRANGGAGGVNTTNGAPGGAGGAGSVVTKTFAQMGWI